MKQCLNCKHLATLYLSRYVSVCVCNISNRIVPPHTPPCEKYERKEQE